jgi:hypothetical protein
MPIRKGKDNGMVEPMSNEPMSDGDLGAAGRTAPEGQSGDYFAAPLGSLRSALLLFVSGTSNVILNAHRSIKELYRARFEGEVPTVGVQDGTVSIEYPRFPSLDQHYYWLERRAEVALNPSVT